MARKLRPSEMLKDPQNLARTLARATQDDTDTLVFMKDLFECWGGSKRLAMDVHAEFQRAAPGGVTRARILEMIQRLVIVNTQQDLAKPVSPTDLTDEELAQAARTYFERLEGFDGKDGSEAQAPGETKVPGL